MTPFRLLGTAAAAGMMLGLALGQTCAVPEPQRRWADDRLPETRARNRIEFQARMATREARTARIVDSIRRSVTGRGGAGLLAGPGLPAGVGQLLAHFATQVPEGVVLAAVVDTLPDDPTWQNLLMTYVLPQDVGDPCLVIARVGEGYFSSERPPPLVPELRNRIPGPCAFAAAFGPPGPGVAAWLIGTDGGFALDGDWSTSPRTWSEDARYDLTSMWWTFSRSGGVDLLGCLHERVDGCARWLDQYTVNRYRGMNASDWESYLGTLGAVASVDLRTRWFFGQAFSRDRYLADLLATRGEEPFRVFWTSDAPLDSAFAGAYGMSIGEWTAEWFRIIGAPRIRELRPVGRAVPGALLVIVLFVSGAVAYASRRTVST